MAIKSHALELRGYNESRITALTHTHITGERSHTTLSSIFDFFSDPEINNCQILLIKDYLRECSVSTSGSSDWLRGLHG